MRLPAESSIRTIALIGAGLIGASLALAVKRSMPLVSIAVLDPDLEAQQWASRAGAKIRLALTLEAALADADLVVMATPMGAFATLFSAIRDLARGDALIIDVASTKSSALALAQQHLGALSPRFVACHPIAGSERSGAAFAHAALFDGRTVVLTPDAGTAIEAVRGIWGFWQAIGARPTEMSASEHDRLFAYLSHLPHLLAFAYMSSARKAGIDASELELAGPGFRDFTRIAAGGPELWSDILLDNRDAVLDLLDLYVVELGAMRAALNEGRSDAILATLGEAQALRRALQ